MLKTNKVLLALSIPLLFMSAQSSFAATTPTSQDVTFSGTLTPSTCTLATDVMSGSIDLPSVDTLSVPSASSFAPETAPGGVKFSMVTTGCDANSHIGLQITGNTVTADGIQVLKNDQTAKGVAVVIGNITSNQVVTPLAEGTITPLASCSDGMSNGCITMTTTSDGQAKWDLAAGIVSTGETVTAGLVSAQADFQIVYD
ncbi:fimbrial protein [Rahnella contaminans]|uniref:fimbrial protein n=1 Tax=Rahnella contaminans TaxID=2703882 RepID=UPI003C2D43F1